MPAFYINEEDTSLPCSGFPKEVMHKAMEIGEVPMENYSRAFLVLPLGN